MSTTKAYDIAMDARSDAKKTRVTASGRNKPARLATRTKWALTDMLHHAKEGREAMQEMMKWIEQERLEAKGRYDTARLARLGELSHIVAGVALHVGELERLAGDAMRGVYVPRLAKAGRTDRHAKQ